MQSSPSWSELVRVSTERDELRLEVERWKAASSSAKLESSKSRSKVRETESVSTTTTESVSNNRTAESKSSAEVRRLQKENVGLRAELLNSYSNYLIHLPKAGGYSAFEYLKRDRAELSVLAVNGGNDGEVADSRVCNHGGRQIDWESWEACWLHSTEGFFSVEPARRFVILRNPLHQVPSFWNYCTTSPKRSKKSKSMPSTLEAWLQTWQDVQNEQHAQNKHNRPNDCPQIEQGGGREKGCPAFKCYNPIDLQTTRLKMHGKDPVDMERYFDVVGITEELEKSTCLISIAIHRKVPLRCDCSRVNGGVGTNNDGTSGNGTMMDDTINNSTSNESTSAKRRMEQRARIDHGVTTHGDEINLSKAALEMIHDITRNDRVLYDVAERIFWKEVERVERWYDIELC